MTGMDDFEAILETRRLFEKLTRTWAEVADHGSVSAPETPPTARKSAH
jgi:hypothetical protein